MNASTTTSLKYIFSFGLGFVIAWYLKGSKASNEAGSSKKLTVEPEKALITPTEEKPENKNKNEEESGSSEEGSEEGSESSEDEELKMVLVVRMDLKMGPGKAAAQCSHATLGAYQRAVKKNLKGLGTWSKYGQMKVTLKAKDEEEILAIERKAKEMGVNYYMVVDAGRTQIQAGSKTVLALGPASKPLLDKITGHLKLY